MHIIILHGWGHSAQMWLAFASKFHKHKVMALDLPGFGKKELVSENWDIKDYANWVVKKIKAKKLNNVILVGHSFGGKIATEVAISYPELVAKLVLISSPVLRRPSNYIKLKIRLYKLIKGSLPAYIKKLFFASEYKDASLNKLGEIFKKSVEYDRTQEITKLEVPVLLIWGDKDETAPLEIAKEMNSLFPNSTLEIVKNAGHNLQFKNQDILFGLIKNFVDE